MAMGYEQKKCCQHKFTLNLLKLIRKTSKKITWHESKDWVGVACEPEGFDWTPWISADDEDSSAEEVEGKEDISNI